MAFVSVEGNSSNGGTFLPTNGLSEMVTTEEDNIWVEDEGPGVSFKLVAYTLIGAVGITDNIFVIFVVLMSNAMRTKYTNWFLINQSLLDALASMWMMVDALDNGRSRYHSGILGEIRCRLLTARYFVWTTYMASTYNLVMISLERYFEIVHAIYYKTHIKWWVVCVMLFLPYLLSGIYNSAAIITARISGGVCMELATLSYEWEFVVMGVGNLLFQFMLPILIISYCYIQIGLFLRNMPVIGGSENPEKAKKAAKASINVIKTLAIVCIIFFLCWMWNSILFFLFSIRVVDVDFNGAFYHFTVTAVNINCLVNPFIYTFKYEQFKREATRIFCRHLSKVHPQMGNSAQKTTST